MDIVLKAKHWQVFAIQFASASLQQSVISAGSELTDDIIYLASILIYLGWILLLGSAINKRLPHSYKLAYKIFMTAGLVLIAIICTLRLLLSSKEIMQMWEAYPIVIWSLWFYTLISIIIVFSFPARALKSIETLDRADINDYIKDIFLLIFWPIGIWYIQPRLNRISSEQIN